MKKIVCLLVVLYSTVSFSNPVQSEGWNLVIDDQGSVGIHSEVLNENYAVTFSFKYNDIFYTKNLKIDAMKWGYVNLKKDFGFKTSSLKKNPGLIKIDLKIVMKGEEIVKEEVFFSPKEDKVLYETDLSSIEDHLHLNGNTIVDSYFWSDKGGYNYVIRSKNSDQAGLYLSYWKVNHRGEAERLDYYKNTLDCCPRLQRVQQHSEEVALNDANGDGINEFYSMVLDGCIQEETEPTGAKLFVFTSNKKALKLEGTTYATDSKHENKGGQYEISANLEVLSEVQEKAKDVWEIFILNF